MGDAAGPLRANAARGIERGEARHSMDIEHCRECGALVVAGLGPDRWGILLEAEPTDTASGYALVAGGRFVPTTATPAHRRHWDVCPAITWRARVGRVPVSTGGERGGLTQSGRPAEVA